MEIWPAIDLRQGQVVRLAEGDMARATVYGEDPAAVAAAFARAGGCNLHVVDLDGAFAGRSVNGEAVRAILAATSARVQVGGGIRTRAQVEAWLEAGVARVILGTAALEDPALVREAAAAHPGAIVVAVDARDGMVATRGWAEVGTLSAVELARRFADAGVAALLFTDIGRDGLLNGVNAEATAALAAAVSIPVLASGGVAGLADIEELKRHRGIAGVIIGRALYEGRFTLAEALAAA
ncbi:MAG: 1-(5-phosphoribosyl)-5-[(5-phosphoribosylamino)methylideneamino]imidazole-4-carboxamide isomerase [Sphingomonadaceae bacterium]